MKVIQKRHRSTEIVLAFMINVPWMGPGLHSSDDETCWYVSLATTIAIDLQMPKISMPTEAFNSSVTGNLARQDCIDPELALRSGGFKDVDPNSELGRRLVRRRERCWIALFVLERGMCLARGRSYTLPMTPLIRRCDRWHISDIADSMDGALVSMAVLRRDLDGLFDAIRSLCDGSREGMTDGSLLARSYVSGSSVGRPLLTLRRIQSTVDKFFEQWYLEWGQTLGTGPRELCWPTFSRPKPLIVCRQPDSTLRRDSCHAYPSFHLQSRAQPPNRAPRSPPLFPHRRPFRRTERNARRRAGRGSALLHAQQHSHHGLLRRLFCPAAEHTDGHGNQRH